MKSSGSGVTSQLTPKTSSSSQSRPENLEETPKATTKSSTKISLKKKQTKVTSPKLACAKCNFVTTDETKYNRHIVVHDLEEDEVEDETPNSPM